MRSIYMYSVCIEFSLKYRKQQEMFVKHVCPPKHECHSDLDLETPNSIGLIYKS